MPTAETEKRLLAYAENFPINDLPGFTQIMGIDSKFIRVNDNFLTLMGYHNPDQIFGTDYYSMPCKAAENAESFEKEDHLALTQEIKILSYLHFNHDWKILLGHKKPIINKGEVIGTLAHFIDMTHDNMIDISRFMLEKNGKIRKKQFSYMIQNTDNGCGLTKKEQACLFYLLRGRSYLEIARALDIAPTTVQTHLEHIKEKFNVQRKSQLVEYAIQLGWMNRIPETLFE